MGVSVTVNVGLGVGVGVTSRTVRVAVLSPTFPDVSDTLKRTTVSPIPTVVPGAGD